MGDRFDPWGGMPKRTAGNARQRLNRLRLDDSKPPTRRLKSLDEFPGISPNRIRSPRKQARPTASPLRRTLALTFIVVLVVALVAGVRHVQQQGVNLAFEWMRQNLAPGSPQVTTTPASLAATPFSTEPRCAWLNDEAARLRSSGLTGGAATVTANALDQKAAETYCLPGGIGLPVYPSMQYVQADLFRLRDAEECRWARGQFLRLASMQPNAGVVYEAMQNREKATQQGCYRY